ncbi:MAG: alpha/beta fold hydrolase [Solirubrobacterales bacterium]
MSGTEATSFEVSSPAGGVCLRGEVEGEGPSIFLLHGLTAHKDLVVHGSSALARESFRVIRYDARGHVRSDPGEAGAHGYEVLADDLDAVLEAEGGEEARPVLCGHSMGAHTIVALALRKPERLAALVVIGPVSTGAGPDEETLERWDRLADRLSQGGVDGFIDAYSEEGFDPEWEETLIRIARDRLEQHEHPEAVAQMLREVPRSIPFSGLSQLGSLQLPCLVVASRDEADSGHPLATAEAYTEALPDARMIVEEEGESPIAWQGGKLSREIVAFCGEDAVAERHRG